MIFLFITPQSDILSELLETVAATSLSSILSLTYMWWILFLVYAMTLNQVFGLTRLGPNTTNTVNFRTITKISDCSSVQYTYIHTINDMKHSIYVYFSQYVYLISGWQF